MKEKIKIELEIEEDYLKNVLSIIMGVPDEVINDLRLIKEDPRVDLERIRKAGFTEFTQLKLLIATLVLFETTCRMKEKEKNSKH